MTDLVRSASLTSFAPLAAERGLDVRALLAEVGLPPRSLDDADLKIPASAVGRLLELAAQRSGEPSFGLLLAEARRLSNLGPLGLLVRDEPTLRHALNAVVTNLYLHNEALSVAVEQVGDLVSIHVGMDSKVAAYRQAAELIVGVMFRVLGIFMGADWRPRLVCFTHRKPENVTVHRRLFGTAVEFGHAFNGIVCKAADLDQPNPGADPVMSRYTHQLLEPKYRRRASVSDRVRELIVLLLPRGHCRVEVVAQHMGTTRRTLARHLDAEATTFSQLVDGVRRELLSCYLEEAVRPLADVSALLGFSAPSAFSRWHRHEFGVAARSRVERVSPLIAPR